MTRTSEFDPVVVDSALSTERLVELLSRGAESAKLDYKESYDPIDGAGRVRLAKHVLAMSNTAGGYILFGVSNDGKYTGLGTDSLDALDEAAIRQQVGAYSSLPLGLFLMNRIEHKGLLFALLVVLPLLDRITVAAIDGQIPGRTGSAGILFRSGDVLVRHGSASERWAQADSEWIMDRIVRSRKDHWLRDFSEDFRRLVELSIPGAPTPIDENTIRQPPAAFGALVQSLLRGSHG